MAHSPKDKFGDFLQLLLTILLDSLVVIAIAFATFIVKWVIEKLYGQTLDKIDNIALFYCYSISKYLLIIFVSIWSISDIIEAIVDTYKKLKK